MDGDILLLENMAIKKFDLSDLSRLSHMALNKKLRSLVVIPHLKFLDILTEQNGFVMGQ